MESTLESPLSADAMRAVYDSGLSYQDYVKTGTPDQQAAWDEVHARAELMPNQASLLSGFTREMKVLVSSGMWCGDCVQQVPFLDRFASASNGCMKVRYIDRDALPTPLLHTLKICGGTRVPVAIFMAEDFEPVSLYGDRTLTRYRALAAKSLGAHCPIPGAPIPEDELRGTLQDWLDEVERVHTLLRLSARLRQRHND